MNCVKYWCECLHLLYYFLCCYKVAIYFNSHLLWHAQHLKGHAIAAIRGRFLLIFALDKLNVRHISTSGLVDLLTYKMCHVMRTSRWKFPPSLKLEKMTPCEKVFKNSFWKDSAPLRSTSCVQISWNLADRKSVKSCIIYLTKKNKIIWLALLLWLLHGSRKICQGQLETINSECPKFHPNLFTSGGVIAGRVNIVETHHKVFPILSDAIASSLSDKNIYNMRIHRYLLMKR